MFIYQADTYCDSCGEHIAAEIDASGDYVALPEDSDHYPQQEIEEATDGPDHCASRDECLEAIDLLAYGLPTVAFKPVLVGAETQRIGALLSDGLTEYGVEYLAEMLAEPEPTPYQEALHRYWREVFSDQLAAV